MQRSCQGNIRRCSSTSEAYEVFIPNDLPPTPEINLSEISSLLDMANRLIGELNGVVDMAADYSLINYMYVRKEALVSSQIEGTQSTLNDLLKYESNNMAGVSIEDAAEASSYVKAINHGLQRIKDGFPLSLRLLREIHKILLQNSRGNLKQPGEFRTSQNWIGGTRPGNAKFVPVAPDQLMETLGKLELFINQNDNLPILVKVALIHVQFETIHPFLDGNGRLGRLLITLFLCDKKILTTPLLYLSLFFKKNREMYYEKLNVVRKNGDWENWINFFLEGIIETARDSKLTIINVQKLFSDNVKKLDLLKRAKDSALRVFQCFQKKPILSIAEIMVETNLTKPTIKKSLDNLTKLGIINNDSIRKWGQMYTYTGYVNLLNPESTNPL